MSLRHQDYALPPTLSADRFIAALAAQMPVVGEPLKLLERTYLDSCDRRLHGAGGVLLAKRIPGDAYSLVWEGSGHGKPLGTVRAADLPIRVADLPPGYLREQLAKVLEARTLLPLAKLRSEVTLLRVLNSHGSTVARLRLETPRCLSNDGRETGRLAPCVTLVPAIGCDQELLQVKQLLESLALGPRQRPLSHAALAAAGVVPPSPRAETGS